MAALTGCQADGPAVGSGVPEANDAGTEAGSDGGLAPPAAPRFQDWDCPPGWTAETIGEGEDWAHSICAPPARVACELGTFQFLPDATCGRLGSPCPAAGERFHAEAEIRALAPGFDGPVVYVDAAADGGGDGQRTAPLRSLAAALNDAAEGAILVLAPGRHRAHIRLSRSVALLGSCVDETILQGPPPGGPGTLPGRAETRFGTVIVREATETLVANLTVTGPRAGVTLLESGGLATLRDLLVDATAGLGIVVSGRLAPTSLEGVVVRGTSATQTDDGRGLVVSSSSGVVASRLIVEDTVGVGIYVLAPGGPPGLHATIEDTVVRTTAPLDDPFVELALSLANGAHVVVRRALFETPASFGVRLERLGDANEADLSDVVIRGVVRHPETENLYTGGFLVPGANSLRGRQVVVEDGTETCGIAWGAEPDAVAELDLDRFVCRRIRATPETWSPVGLVMGNGSRVTVARAVFEDIDGFGVGSDGSATEPPRRLHLSDFVIRDIVEGLRRDVGNGISVGFGTQATLERGRIVDTTEIGVAAFGWGGAPETRVTASDLVVQRVAIAECGILPPDYDRDRDVWACADEAGRGLGGGLGVLGVGGARLSLTDFELVGAELAALAIARGAIVSAERGTITDNAVGVSIPDPDFDLDERFSDVYIYGNRTDIARDDLPLPKAPAMAGADE